ncbi:39638_t:CDS:2, partial [Gigaspora margarita]
HEPSPIVQPEINLEAGPDNIELQPIQELFNYKGGFLDLNIEDMFKIDETKYAFSTWFAEAKEIDLANIILEAENEDKAIQEPIHKSKKAGRKYVKGGPNIILTKKMKPRFWIGKDEKFLVREVSGQSEVEELDNNAGPQAIWLMGVEDGNQRVSQFILEDGRIFRTQIKHTDIIKTCKKLFDDAIDWQFCENIINEEKKSIFLKFLKVVDLAEQVFETNYTRSQLANEINEWYLITRKINNVIKQACVEHRHIAINRELPEDDITGFAQYGKHFACRDREGYGKEKGWVPIVLLQYLLEIGILESVTIGE